MNPSRPDPETTAPGGADFKRRRLLVTLAAVIAIAGLVGAALGCNAGTRAGELVESLRAAGPQTFFLAMALLPAVGFPIAVFNIAAGPAFAGSLGVWQVVLLASASIAANVAIAYWISRYALRPVITRLLAWLGYTVPVIPRHRHLTVAFLVRITPGPPFFLQSCLLGLAEVPFLPYMFASWSIASAYAAAVIVCGDALMKGKIRTALLAFAALGVLALGLKLFRKKSAA